MKRDKSIKAESGDAPAGSAYESQAIATRTAVLEKATEVAPVIWQAPDQEAIDVSRRQFFNRASIFLVLTGTAAFGASLIAFCGHVLVGVLVPRSPSVALMTWSRKFGVSAVLCISPRRELG